MMTTIGSANWSLEIPAGWQAKNDPECFTVSGDSVVGALQFSSAAKDGMVSDADLLDFAADHLAHGARPRSVTPGGFSGFEISYEEEQTWWRIWYLRSHNLVIFITYNCDARYAGNEDARIDSLLAKLKYHTTPRTGISVEGDRMDDEKPKPKRKLNAAQKRTLRAEQLRLFVKQVGRPAQKGIEPNDRNHDRSVGRKLRAMKPEELDALLRDGDED